MTRGLRTIVMGSAVLLVSACATSVAGTAQVGPGVVVPNSVAVSSGPTAPSLPQSFPDPTDVPQSIPVPSSAAPPSESAPSSEPAPSPVSSAQVSSAAPPTTASSTPTTTKTTPTTSKAVSLPTKLHCASGALTGKGGSFCYKIPAGFTDTSSTATYPGTDPVKTAVQPADTSTGGARDLIFVTSTTLSVNSDDLSDALIKASLKQALGSGSTGSTTTPLVQSKVAGDRAFETTIKFADGVMQRYLLVFAGKTRVSISCQWDKAKTVITTACQTVLSTMQIKNP